MVERCKIPHKHGKVSVVTEKNYKTTSYVSQLFSFKLVENIMVGLLEFLIKNSYGYISFMIIFSFVEVLAFPSAQFFLSSFAFNERIFHFKQEPLLVNRLWYSNNKINARRNIN